MAAVKTMREKMANEGMTSFIVTYDYREEGDAVNQSYMSQFWAEGKPHAAEQLKDDDEGARIISIETQDGYETRTGEQLDYGNHENV